MPKLTDEQCMNYRQMRGSFNDMVRAIYADGYNAGLDRAAEVAVNFESGNKEIVIATGLIAGRIRGKKC